MEEDLQGLSDKRNALSRRESPLSGIRVLDLTRLWSGPLTGRILADLGAEVIHIVGRATLSGAPVSAETACRLGIYPENRPGERPWNRLSSDHDFHRNKKSLTLELQTPEGRELFKRLVRKSDVVLENFSPRVMANFGLTYEELKKIRSDIIYCSLSGYGHCGPKRDDVAYGSNIEAFSGLSSLTGYTKEGPLLAGNPFPDAAAALHGAAAVLTALVFRQRSGQGQHIDLSQAESAACLIGETVLAFGLTGEVPRRRGNRHLYYAPHGCYRCRGEDQWLALAVFEEEEWRALARIIDRPDWLKEEKLAHPRQRVADQDELDQAITAWTEKRTPDEAMTLLQKAGVPAGAVRKANELLDDPHLGERGFFVTITHPECGPRRYCSLPIGFSGFQLSPGRPAPCLGQDNDYILQELLGFSEEEVKDLEEKGVVGDRPLAS